MESNETLVNETVEDYGNLTALDCPEYTKYHFQLMDFFTLWIEGVLNCVIAGAGFIANAVSAYILSR